MIMSKNKILTGLLSSILVFMESSAFARQSTTTNNPTGMGAVESAGRLSEIVKELREKRFQFSDLVKAAATNFSTKETMSSRMMDIAADINAKLNKLELETWAEKEQTLPLRSKAAEIAYMTIVLGEEKSVLAYEAEIDSLQTLLDEFDDRLKGLTRDVESMVFSDVKRHAQVVAYEGDEIVIPKQDRDNIDRFLSSQKAKKAPPAKVTILAWSRPGQHVDLADKRAEKAQRYVEAIYSPKEIHSINMDKNFTLFQKLFKTEEYKIKEAYRSHEYDDTREKTIGWFLSRAAGPNHIVLLFE